jgi:ABC-type amino acid transport substrate-binding protein
MPEVPYVLSNIQEGKIEGIIGDLWHGILEKSLNFTTIISTPPDDEWGSCNENGSWNGMVGGLLENRADVILASLYNTLSRSRVIDYSVTLDEITMRM